MHEIKLTENLLAILEREVKDPAVGEVKVVHLDVGKLRYVVPDIMTSCFENVPKSEKLIGAKLEIKVLPIKIKCSECGAERVVDDGVYSCCDGAGEKVEITSGKEFKVRGIEW